MWKDFNVKYPIAMCTYSVFRGMLSDDMKIGFTKLGGEQCEICLAHNTATGHNHDCSKTCDDCSE